MLCRAVTAGSSAKPFRTRSALGVYACARIVAEGADNVMIAFAFDLRGFGVTSGIKATAGDL